MENKTKTPNKNQTVTLSNENETVEKQMVLEGIR